MWDASVWVAFVAFVLVALAVDFFAMNHKGPKRVSIRVAALWSLAWVAVSFVFMGILWWYAGGAGTDPAVHAIANTKTLEFLTGYLIEKALAVDNVFVFLLVFTFFRVPLEYQRRILMLGIIGALVLRAVMILLGAWVISEFHWVLYLFGFFLVYTAVKMWQSIGKEPDLESSRALRWIKNRVRMTSHFDEDKLFTKHDGARVATPLFAVVLMIGIVDIVFAVDSIPAIFAVTTDPFIVLTSNVFAILGLRAMYFLLARMHEQFHLLSYGLAIVLFLIGTKMLLMDIVHISVVWSLVATVVVLATSVILSIYLPMKGVAGSAYPFRAKEEGQG
jgi:tellurite resistance protein TerC